MTSLNFAQGWYTSGTLSSLFLLCTLDIQYNSREYQGVQFVYRQAIFFVDVSDHSYFAAFNSHNALSYLKFIDLIL